MARRKKKAKFEVSRYPWIEENHIKDQVKDWLTWRNFFHFHNLGGLGSYPGLDDRTAIKDGIVLFIEVKRPPDKQVPARWEPGKQSPDQKKFQKNVEEKGGIYLLINDVEELDRAVSDIWTKRYRKDE